MALSGEFMKNSSMIQARKAASSMRASSFSSSSSIIDQKLSSEPCEESIKQTPAPLPCRPFVKWVGGKRSIIQDLRAIMPPEDSYKNYFEPFVGGGRLFFESAFSSKRSFLSDVNENLIYSYDWVKKDPARLLERLEELKKDHSKESYYEARKEFQYTANQKRQEKEDTLSKAALFIYLNKTCYNGLYRVNSKGEFNVPMGSYKNPSIYDEQNIFNCSKLLQNTEISVKNYRDVKPRKNDFVYLDPPYDEAFAQYNKDGFGKKSQEILFAYIENLDRKGVSLMLSNADTELIRKLYSDKKFYLHSIDSVRSISCKSSQRGKQKELLITNFDD